MHANFNSELNKNYLKTQKHLNLYFNNQMKNRIKIAIYTFSLIGGGLQRQTSLFLYYLRNIKIFDIYLFTLNICEKEDFFVPKNIKRVFIKDKIIFNLIRQIKKKKLIYLYINILE
jgi:hypothetical protein